jgi:insertion element IS1 protein InsB
MCIATCGRLLCILGFGDRPKYTGALIFQELFTFGDSSQILNPANFEKKAEPRWLWHAIDHHSGTVLAYVFGRRKAEVFLHLQELLAPFHITRFYTDGWGADERHIDPAQHTIGKAHTQKIESTHINVRTRIKRLVRRTICFSKTTTMHDLVLGLFINRYEFGVAL